MEPQVQNLRVGHDQGIPVSIHPLMEINPGNRWHPKSAPPPIAQNNIPTHLATLSYPPQFTGWPGNNVGPCSPAWYRGMQLNGYPSFFQPPAIPYRMPENPRPMSAADAVRLHVALLKPVFDRVIVKQYLPAANLQEAIYLYNQLQNIILAKKPDAQVTLYGSVSFACCLTDSAVIDIDVQCNEPFPYNTLREVSESIHASGFGQDILLSVDGDPYFVEFVVRGTNFRMRITSNYSRGIYFTELISRYIRCDTRVLPLLRLFRFFTKTCSLDKPDEGTLHPFVFHIMVIHFLQQIHKPVLPCLHEYVLGIDQALLKLNDDQYIEFFRACNDGIRAWKSENNMPIELLFLQLLSYYDLSFAVNRYMISVQTRMPILKENKQKSRQNPTDINRNLAYTMKANSSLGYLQNTFRKALSYLCKTNKKSSIENTWLVNEINGSFITLFSVLLSHIRKSGDITQDDIRQTYYHSFNNESKHRFQPKLQINHKHEPDRLNNEKIGNEQQINYSHSLNENIIERPVPFDTLVQCLDENKKTAFRFEYQKHVREFNEKMHDFINKLKELPTSDSSASLAVTKETRSQKSTGNANISIQLEHILPIALLKTLETMALNNAANVSHEFVAKSFCANKGPPRVCTICSKTDHVKSDCIKLSLPNMVILPEISKHWADGLSQLCRKITGTVTRWIVRFDCLYQLRSYLDECKMTNQDIEQRETILTCLETEFRKIYPNCRLHPAGSFKNGFGFRQSDLDVCVQLETNSNESSIQTLENLAEFLQSKQLLFKNIEIVRNARVPIIRSTHAESNIEVDISLNNMLPVENTRLLRIYSDIDPRVRELGFVIKTLAKQCNICDASRGTLSSYAYTIMVIHFLQQIQPPVIPVLQQLNDDSSDNVSRVRKCGNWNVYFYDNLKNLSQIWDGYGLNKLSSGELWVEFLCYYTERFNYGTNIVTIRQVEPLLRSEKGWFHPTIAIEDPFILTHDLTEKLSLRS
ncbi:unnamed protein product [Rotaria magnacalcarata]|uniref:Uncharacterized protein n=1 Tax=Rotaria magnacalcarata TaxID=392030 RepID=A0A816TRL3_9BILA|nr:unnamed protein product [Rotaria magnacalcarata]CAF4155054.1 unnamed protein product [Rotaria magnacalcarata]